jgi:hypothetical protein
MSEPLPPPPLQPQYPGQPQPYPQQSPPPPQYPQQQGYSQPSGYQPPPPPGMPAQMLGYASPMTGAVNAAWRRGNQVVATRDAELGDACVKCGAPAEGWRWNKTVYWISPAFLLLFFLPFGLIILLIVYLIVRKSAKVSAGLCPAHRSRRMKGILITTVLALAGAVGLVVGIGLSAEAKSSDPPIGIAVALASVVMLITSAVTGTTMARVLTPAKVDDHYAWYRGAGEGYLRLLNSTP